MLLERSLDPLTLHYHPVRDSESGNGCPAGVLHCRRVVLDLPPFIPDRLDRAFYTIWSVGRPPGSPTGVTLVSRKVREGPFPDSIR